MLVAQLADHRQQLAKREALINELEAAVERGASESKEAEKKLQGTCQELSGSATQNKVLTRKLEESKGQIEALIKEKGRLEEEARKMQAE